MVDNYCNCDLFLSHKYCKHSLARYKGEKMEVYEEKAFTAIYPKKPVGKPKFVNKSLQKD